MIHIAIHIQPQEIDSLQELLIQMKRSRLPKGEFFVTSVMNCNLINWNTSAISINFFRDKFFDLEGLTMSWAGTDFIVDRGNHFLGCNDVRRHVARTTTCEWVSYFDADNIFSHTMLSTMLDICEILKNDFKDSYSIICPEVTRMWDPTWDVITNEKWMREPFGHEHYDERDPYEVLDIPGLRNAQTISGFKFAGWGTTFQTSLLKIIGIPDSLGSYGLDDTFIMYACQIMKNAGFNVIQYHLENEVIIENNLFRINPYKNYLSVIDKKNEFLAQAHANFNPELKKFEERLCTIQK